MRKAYPEEIRKAVLSAAKSGESVASLSEEYGVSRAAIYSWIKQYEDLSACKYARKPNVSQKFSNNSASYVNRILTLCKVGFSCAARLFQSEL